MVIVSFAHHKGGTGKTTSCINISGYLVKQGKKVLVVDLDPQANATSGLGVENKAVEGSMYDVMLGDAKIRDIILETESGVYLAPATLDLVGAASYMYKRNNRATTLKHRMGDIGKHYDYIMIDTPPGPGLFIVNGVVASDHAIVTLDPSVFALEGIETLSMIFGDINESVGVKINPLMGILTKCNNLSLFSRMMGKRNPEKEIGDGMKKFFEKIYTVPYCVEVYEAQLRGLPISHYKPDCKAGLAYKNIVDEVIKHGEN